MNSQKVLVTISKMMDDADDNNLLKSVTENMYGFLDGADVDFFRVQNAEDESIVHIPYSTCIRMNRDMSRTIELEAERDFYSLAVCMKILKNRDNPAIKELEGCGNLVKLAEKVWTMKKGDIDEKRLQSIEDE